MTNKRVVLFVDGTAPRSYDPTTFTKEGLGGTESTVIRVAEGLAATGLFVVYVETHNRTENVQFGALYCKPETCQHADYIISLRYPQLIPLMQKRFPRARHYLWCHDLAQPSTARDMVALSGFEAIAVSNYHKIQMTEVMKPQGYTGQFPVKVVYNPIDDDLLPDETPVDHNKLVWFSSPHKGLDYALGVFANLRNFNERFLLYVANPGYLENGARSEPQVNVLGSLPHRDVIHHVRSSLCVFYPNPVFPETFGLVLAEANAVGTPVITHPIGAAPEVLFHPAELTDCRNPKNVIDRVMAWHSGARPKVKANPKFRLSAVVKAWMRLFG